MIAEKEKDKLKKTMGGFSGYQEQVPKKSRGQLQQEQQTSELLDSLLYDQWKAERDGLKAKIMKSKDEMASGQIKLLNKLHKKSKKIKEL